MAKKYDLNHEFDKLLSPEDFLSDPSQFRAMEDYEVDFLMKNALKDAQPCKNAPIDPVEEPEVPGAPAVQEPETADVAEQFGNAPSFDFGADDQTNALLLQDAQTFITGNMARIMAAKHAHDLCANNRNGTWGKWCDVVGISRDTGDNMVHIAEQFGNIQIDGQSIFDVRPMKLLYAAARPSTPEPVKQAVFSGDITTYKEYQELMAQLKTAQENLDHEISQNDALHEEKGRLLRECEAAKQARAEAENRADTAEGQLDAATADVQGLTQRNAKLNAEKEQALQRAKAAEDALKRQPITAVVDEEEVDRRAHQQAYSIAADMTEELKADKARLQKNMDELKQQLSEAQAVVPADLLADKETADSCYLNIDGIWGMALPSFRRLVGTGEDFNSAAGKLIQLCDHIHEELVKMTIANDKETLYE